MTEQRITILDASYSIFSTDIPTSKPKPSSNGLNGNANGSNGINHKNSNSDSSSNSNSVDGSVMLQPIPNFKKVVSEIVAGESGNGVFSIDVGLICGVDAVKRVGKAIHDRLVAEPAELSAAGKNAASS
jgi:hypothetical protein